MIRFGPAGLGGVKEAISNLELYHKLGLKACEIAFTYGAYIKESQKKEIEEIRKTAEKFDIKLSIHAHYWINLNSAEKKKIEESKKRILQCCRVGELLGAYAVVFHAGYYSKHKVTKGIPKYTEKNTDDNWKEESFQNIKREILELMGEIKKNKWKIKLAPETTGKNSVFGDQDEILRLSSETGCFFCTDFSHLLARSNGKAEYKEMVKKLVDFKELHCHFSGIEYNEKGERRHLITPIEELRKLLAVIPKNKEIVIINESPQPVEDSEKMLKTWEKLS